jgi:hypothetical protein
MSEGRNAFGFAGFALLPLCCLGVPLLIAAGILGADRRHHGRCDRVRCGDRVAHRAQTPNEGTVAPTVTTERARRSSWKCGVTAREGRSAAGRSSRSCPSPAANHIGAIELVERVSGGLGLDPEIRVLEVPDQEAAQRLRFLGSPTIRVGGRDVDPHAEERSDYALSCRLFRTEAGIAGQPDERWVWDALLREAAGG